MNKGKMNIPFLVPDIREEDIEEVVKVLRSGWITTGPTTKQFENNLAKYCHTKKVVCLCSATAALELSLRMLGVGPGDEVIVPAYTYTASASVVLHVGATLVLVDAKPDSVLMDPERVKAAITEKTKAIIPVDIAGVMCDYDALYEVVEAKKESFTPSDNKLQQALGRIAIVADGAHSLGASYKDKMSGEAADFTCFSFHAVKNLTTAEGGAVTWRTIKGISDAALYQKIVLYSLHGQSKDALSKTNGGSWEYDILYPAYKANMTDIQAALGLSELRRYSAMNARRKTLIERYKKGFEGLPIKTLEHDSWCKHSNGHLMITWLEGKSEAERNHFITALSEKGITANVHFKPLPMHTGYQAIGFHIEDYPNAYNLFKNEVTLPLYPGLQNEAVDYICEVVGGLLK